MEPRPTITMMKRRMTMTMMKVLLESSWGTIWRMINGTEKEEKKGYRGVKRMEVHYKYTMKTA
jgi:hypothetical protein